jgi:hypothetical protein
MEDTRLILERGSGDFGHARMHARTERDAQRTPWTACVRRLNVKSGADHPVNHAYSCAYGAIDRFQRMRMRRGHG